MKQAGENANHLGETNARETILRAVEQSHIKKLKSKTKSNSMTDLRNLDQQQMKTTNSNKSCDVSVATAAAADQSSSISSLLLKNIYSQIFYEDLKMRKLDQMRNQIWTHVLDRCMNNLSESDAYVNNLCKKHHIVL